MRSAGTWPAIGAAGVVLAGLTAGPVIQADPGRATGPEGRWVLVASHGDAYPICPGQPFPDCGANTSTSPGGGRGALTMQVEDHSGDGTWTGTSTGRFTWSDLPAELHPGDPWEVTISLTFGFDGNRANGGATMFVSGDQPIGERSCGVGTASGFRIVDLLQLGAPGSADGRARPDALVPGPDAFPTGLQVKVCGKVDGAVNSWIHEYAWRTTGEAGPSLVPPPAPTPPPPTPMTSAAPRARSILDRFFPARTIAEHLRELERRRGTRSDSRPAAFSSLTGTVEISPDPDAVDWEPCTLRRPIQPGDHIKTSRGSSAIVTFPDGTTYVMAPDTEIVYAGEPDRSGQWDLVVGRVKVNTGRLLRGEGPEIETSQAVAGVKGTIFVVEAETDRTTVKVIHGVVKLRPLLTPVRLVVPTGHQATVGPGGVAIRPLDAAGEAAAWASYENAERTPASPATAAAAAARAWAGDWQTTWGLMHLEAVGDAIEGTYAYQGGRIEGTVEGTVLVGTWSEEPTRAAPSDAGEVRFQLTPDGRSFTGQWRYGSTGEWATGWDGSRLPGDPPEP